MLRPDQVWDLVQSLSVAVLLLCAGVIACLWVSQTLDDWLLRRAERRRGRER